MTALPEGWRRCRLGDVVDYGATRKAEPAEIPSDAWVLELEDIEKDTSNILQRQTFASAVPRAPRTASRRAMCCTASCDRI